MHSSFSVSLEPGLDRGVPWGRDLYTFVTSAAGHMMRTLQKPRKNRPSKRQVNHRRFLHNMIQRKFADIEAANHRLASALYFKVDEKKPDTPDTPSPPQTNSLPASEKSTAVEDILLNSKDCVTIDSQDTEMRGKEQPDLRQLWKQHPKSRKNKQTQKKTICDQNLLKCTPINSTCIDRDTEPFCGDENPTDTHFPVDPPADLTESSFLQFGRNVDTSPCFSPELSPLSLDSCDLSAQMFTDISSCTPAQKSIGEIAESQWADIIDLFSVGSKDFRGCANVDAYFESICEYQSDAEGKAGTEDELEELFCERSQCKYEYSCHSNQVATPNPFPIELSSSEFTSHNESPTETQLNNFSSNSTNILQTELPSSMNYNSISYQHPPQESLCMLGQYEHNLIPFEGVAQSFSAPSHDVQRCSILTPPHEGEWLFTDILTDRTLSLS